MSSTGEDTPVEGISDDELPDDLVPGDDNPLAAGLDPEETPEDLEVLEGKGADEWDDEQLED